MAGRIKYGTNVFEHTVVDNYYFSDGTKATNMSGFAGIGTTGYCVKRGSGVEKSALFKINNYTTTSPTPTVTSKTELPFATYGMTTDGTYLYIAATQQSVYKVSTSGTTIDKYTSNIGTQAIAHYTGNQFIFMANALNSADKKTLCFIVGELKNAGIVETARFYVKNTAFDTFNELTLQDIYYDSQYGLFIITNEQVNGAYNSQNLILRVELGSNVSAYAGKTLVPVSEYKFDGKEAKYKQCNVESMVIGPDKRLYTVANIVPSANGGGHTKDGMFYVGNLRFYTDKPFWCKIYFNAGVDIPSYNGTVDGVKYNCGNPGAFALDGKSGYCVATSTNKNYPATSDNASVLMKTTNIDTKAFARVHQGVLRGLGHANGMAYFNGSLYVAAYDRNRNQKDIVELSPNGIETGRYECEVCIGGISHYKGNEFILLNYDKFNNYSYSERPTFFIGTFNENTGKFVRTRYFTTDNPLYDPSANLNVLQDMHYDELYGLYFICKSDENESIYRILPEDVDNAANGSHVNIAECLLPDDSVKELESICVSEGKMYAINNTVADKACLVQTLNFY